MDDFIQQIQHQIDSIMGSKLSKYSDKQLEGFEKSINAGKNTPQKWKKSAETSKQQRQDILNGMTKDDFNKKYNYVSNSYYYTLKKKLGK